MKRSSNVLLYFLQRRSLSRTEIMKYLYLYEYIYRKQTGKAGTELKFVRWDYGPFEDSIYSTLDTLSTEGVISTLAYVNQYGKPTYKYSTANKFDDGLHYTEKEVAEYVMYEFSKRTFQGMLDLVYSTPPMLKILAAEEQSESKLFGEVLPMSETNGVFKRTRAGRDEALKRLAARDHNNASAEEYTKVILQEYGSKDTLRRRAHLVAQRSNP